jgi:hypothetical protein
MTAACGDCSRFASFLKESTHKSPHSNVVAFASANSRSSAQTFNIAPTSTPKQPHPVSVGLRQALNVESSEVTAGCCYQ